MIRLAKTLTTLTLAALFTASVPTILPTAGHAAAVETKAPSLPLMLRDRVTMEGGDLMLSHLFANLPADADQRIGEAPAPGQRLVIGARQLWQYAKAVGLAWRPTNAKQSVVITRASVEVPMEAISEIIADRLASEGLADDFDIEVFGRTSKLFVAAGTPIDLSVDALSFTPRTKRFDGTVSVRDGGVISVSGRIVPVVEVPMLRRHAMPGQVITDEMIVWQRVPARQAGVTTVTRHEDIVGHTARRPVTAGVPVRMTDLKPNLLVTKGNLITLMVLSGNMTLTARGEALDSGTEGAVIRVRNSHSKRVIEAKVVAPDIAVVEPATLAALNG